MKTIKLLATGGTIASTPGADSLTPGLRAQELLAYLPGLDRLCRAQATDILNMDSSNIQPEEWRIIAHSVMAALQTCDGVVITHGTDTMAYTAAALSFMLRGLDKCVVLTGSQLPITELFSDARGNLATAFACACAGHPGVYLAFNNRIIHGTRAFKFRSMGFDAFRSINAPDAGYGDARGVHIEHPLTAADPTGLTHGERRLFDAVCPNVCLLKLIPGTDPALLGALIGLGYRGVVIEAFGVGGFHYLRRNLPDTLRRLHDAGVAVVVTTQCLYDSTDLNIYEVGSALRESGIISARDMTTEAAVTKLMWVLAHTDDLENVARMMTMNICGEITDAPE
jgi:L-asparaginase